MVSLRWDDPADDSITSYQVLRRDADTDDPGVFSIHVDDTGSADNSYVDRDVEPDTRYVYRIKARNAAGLSEQSSYFNADTLTASADESSTQPTPEPTPELAPAPKGRTTAKSADDPPDPCPDPTPTAVTVTSVPIVVTSTTTDYFVLYVSHDVDGTEVESPVLVKKGAVGTTTLAENVEALPKERYRVEKYLIADPADVDGDCIDDITELDDFGNMNPVNSAGSLNIIDGVVGIPDRATFEAIVHSGRYTKFVVFDLGSESQRVYFQNANTHPSHRTFLDVLRDKGIEEHVAPGVLGSIDYHPDIVAANGSPGVYVMSDFSTYSFNIMHLFHTMMAASMPLVDQDLAVYLRNFQLLNYQEVLPLFDDSRIHVIFAKDIYAETFVPLNEAVGYGLLRVLEADERPHSRDVVIYEALPNDLPRVAGIISTVPQTPLSHVNLRAVQSGVPNSYIRDALDKNRIDRLIGSNVRYEVTLIWLGPACGHQGGSRRPLRIVPSRHVPDPGAGPLGQNDHAPQRHRL